MAGSHTFSNKPDYESEQTGEIQLYKSAGLERGQIIFRKKFMPTNESVFSQSQFNLRQDPARSLECAFGCPHHH